MTKQRSLSDTYQRVLKNDPDGSRKDHFKAFLAEVSSDPKLIEALAEDYFERMYARWKIQRIGKSHSIVGTPATERRAEQSRAQRQNVKNMVSETVGRITNRINRIVLMEMTMPNGKRLRDCTGAELTRFGGFYSEVARHLKPSQVVDKHMNESDLQAIWSRYGGKAA